MVLLDALSFSASVDEIMNKFIRFVVLFKFSPITMSAF